MSPKQLRIHAVFRYVNVFMMWYFASHSPMPINHWALFACSGTAFVGTFVLHMFALRTGQWRTVAYAALALDIITIVPAIYLTGVVTSPFLVVLPITINTVYFVEYSLKRTMQFGVAVLGAFAFAFGLWWYNDFVVQGWRPGAYPVFTLMVMALQMWVMTASLHQSTFLPTPILEELTERKSELERQHHRAEMGVSLSMVAHELRNPLTAVGGGLEIAQMKLEQAGPKADVAVLRAVETGMRELERVKQMLEDLLSYARDRKGVTRRAPVELLEVAERALEFTRLKHGRAKARIGITEQATRLMVNGDRDGLYQVIVNLIDNAVTAEVEGRPIQIGITLASRDRVHTITIEDNGCGMPPELAATVFTPFVTQRTGGTGLGMPIVARLVQDHDGEIALTSTVNQGTRVVISLPGLDGASVGSGKAGDFAMTGATAEAGDQTPTSKKSRGTRPPA